ncbi:cell envelope biogenesis protein OmpA [Brevirhabdus pacifica]|uniref:Cell envelope biogenesis protein OmpA n=1 Tax=Brevirhabdus pacifica TaxID=1267768 RepID=A0A1U7DIY7_9RHOB|nr:phosphate ABC transporter substrate-binding/OmpA family protein [Brevirhabdus pacifica]APX89869.1 cell envelope biogenesis protein OmpA [Brevirhabdus pacifica]OWU74410.1 cell envelope biogenesis protein OmpA [Loktanella sp. 22II-4b]PJJ82912.1 phosphate ABC transporter substrate-binding protein (PhoT family) [Brevirhabdus pacifica]
MPNRPFRAALAAAAVASLAIGPAVAQDVTLTSRDGTVDISGTLQSYDGEFYRVDTVYGPLTIDGQGVICNGIGCPDLEAFVAEFALSGSAAMGQVLLPALVDAFARQRGLRLLREVLDESRSRFVLSDPATGTDQARITLRLSSSEEGFADLAAGEADLALSLREIGPEELSVAALAGLGDLSGPRRSLVLALDALVPVVAAANPLRALTPDELAAVFAGEVSDWSALGGAEGPISLHAPAGDSALGQLFAEEVLAPFGKTMSGQARRHADVADLVDAVADDPGAIGLTAWSEMGNTAPLDLRGSCGAVLAAEVATLKSEDYPLSLPLMLYSPARRLPLLAREFIAFFDSSAAELVIRRAGFVDQGIDRTPLARQGARLTNAILGAGGEVPLEELQRLARALRGAERLSTTFRFEGGSSDLDAQSRGNVARLAQAIETGAFDGRQLVFVGFSDGEGGAMPNRAISRRRAEAVRKAVRAEAHTADFSRLKLTVDAFGEALPMACDDSAWGRRVNRRVELWLR